MVKTIMPRGLKDLMALYVLALSGHQHCKTMTMKPHRLKINTEPQNSFEVRHDVLPYFKGVWHCHPHLELHYVIKGEGARLVGDRICNFSAGDMVLIGENLPHCWRCGPEYFQAVSGLNIEAIVVQFMPDCFGHDLLSLPEAHLLPKLFESAKAGLCITGNTRLRVGQLMHTLVKSTGISRLITMITILKELSETSEYHKLTFSKNHFYVPKEMDAHRINSICSYTLAHFKREISLEEIAGVGNLSTTSFCRYFKLMTHQKYFDFLTQVRIGYACRLLIDNKLSTAVICFESGFYNLSNFYRHFKKHTGMTPLTYKNAFTQQRSANRYSIKNLNS
jgi:AraC-like DNA-binding protein/quercetin dioxygenase-like cupin family protein